MVALGGIVLWFFRRIHALSPIEKRLVAIQKLCSAAFILTAILGRVAHLSATLDVGERHCGNGKAGGTNGFDLIGSVAPENGVGQGREGVVLAVHPAAIVVSRIAADGAVGQGRGGAVVQHLAAADGRRIAADGAVEYCWRG